MSTHTREDRRSRLGYGSAYRKGTGKDMADASEIGAVLAGQAWMIKPDRQARAAHPCLWMKAGVTGFKSCANFYDCNTCKYDRGMQRLAAEGKQSSWQDAMRRRPARGRVCRHSLTGRIERRLCAHDYRCAKCEFDQFFEDVWNLKTKAMPREMQHVKGFGVPVGYYFHEGHAWARIESGGHIRIGLDDFALKLFGRPDGLELPPMGKTFDRGQAGWGLRRRGNQAEVLSPVDGIIMEVNANLRENPGTVNREPYGDGWLFMVRTPDVKQAMKQLMTDAAGLEWTHREVDQLETMVEKAAGPLAADGGYFGEDIYGNLPQLDWKELTRTFLKTT